MSEQDQSQLPKDDDNKRKLDEMKSDDEGGVEKPSDEDMQNKKMKTTDSTVATTTTGSSTSSPPVPPQVVYLKHGQIYRLQSSHLGNFHFRAGDMPFFHVNGAPVTISDLSGNVIFSGGTLSDRVELNEVTTGWLFKTKTTSVTVLPGENPRPQLQLKGNSMFVNLGFSTTKSADEQGTSSDPPLQLVGSPKEGIVMNGKRSAVVNGSGGVLTFNGSGVVTVQGSLEGIRNNGSGTVKVIGSVNGDVRQTGSGVIKIDGDVHADILNSGGGSIEVAGKHLGKGNVKNVPGGGRVSIANGDRKGSMYVPSWTNGWGLGKTLG